MKRSYFKHVLVILVGTLLVVFAFSAMPSEAHAQSLVVCGAGNLNVSNPSDPNSATGCQACHIFELIDRLVRFLILISIPIASLLFAYAGFLYFSSGVTAHSEATAIFKDVLFGFIIALCGFLIVDTIIKSLVSGSFVGPSWNTVQCVSGSQRNIVGNGLGFTDLPNLGGLFNPDSAPPPYSSAIGSGICSPNSEWISSFGSGADKFSCICGRESSGQPIDSGIDRSWVDNQAFSTGYLQINMVSTGPFTCDPSGTGQMQTFDCRQAFSASSAESRSLLSQCRTTPQGVKICGSGGFAYQVVDQAKYNDCKRALATPQCNFAAAQYLYNNGGFKHWSTSAQACGAL